MSLFSSFTHQFVLSPADYFVTMEPEPMLFDLPNTITPGTRALRANGAIIDFLCNNPSLKLGGDAGFISERSDHQKIFGIHNLKKDRVYPIHEVEFTAIRGPHGTIPIRVLYPESGEDWRRRGEAAALIYFHGGGYTVGSVDEFENGLRLLAEESACQVISIRSGLSHLHGHAS